MINFHPFIGTEYKKQSPKVLIMLASHNGDLDESNDHDMTNRVMSIVMKRGLAGVQQKVFTNIEQTLLGYKPNLEEGKSFWNKFSVYNFYQTLQLSNRKSSYKKTDRAQGLESLNKVIDDLSPDIILCFSCNVFYALTPEYVENKDIDQESQLLTCNTINSNIKIICLNHPSQGFSSSATREKLKKFIPQIFI